MTARAIKMLTGAAIAPLLCGAVAGPAWAASAAPPGNNGTIKVDGQPLDQGHDNEPHPGCTFRITMFGFDAGTDAADVTFALQPPSGTKPLLHDQFSFTATRAHGGATYDGASPVYDLAPTLAGVTASKQGFHVKVSVSVNGGNAKHKVFWIQPCTGATAPAANAASAPSGRQAAMPASAAAAPVNGPATAPAASAVGSATVSAAGAPLTAAAVPMAGAGTIAAAPAAGSAPAGTAVLGEQIERPLPAVGAASASRSGALPFTGFDVVLWSLAGLGAIGAGFLLVRRGGRSASA